MRTTGAHLPPPTQRSGPGGSCGAGRTAGPAGHPCAEILDLVPVGVLELDAEGRVVRANRAVADLFGQDPDAVVGHFADDLGWYVVGADGVEDRRRTLARLVAAASPDTGPLPPTTALHLRHDDGRQFHLRVRGHRLSTGGFAVMLADATLEHRLQEEAAERQERYRLLADHVGDVVLVHRGRRVVWASPSAGPALGVEPEALVGRSLDDLAHPDDVRDLPPMIQGEPPPQHRMRLRHQDGADGYRWFSATLSARWEDGEPIEVYAALRDIEDQVAAEGAAAGTERQLRLIFDASPDGCGVYEALRDASGDVTGLILTSINAAALALSGRPLREVIGREARTIVPQVVESGIYDQMLAVLAGAGPLRNRHVLDYGVGARVFDSVLTLLDSDLVLAIWRDVTDAIEGERMLERAYEETAEMRATLQTALDATSDGFAVYALEWDADHAALVGLRVVHANAAAALMLGLDPDDMIDMELHDLLPDVEAVGLWARIVDAAATKAPQQLRVHRFEEPGPDGEPGEWRASWDYSVAPVGEERMAITWRDVSAEEGALRQLARHRDEAMHSATHDALTGLPNRSLLLDHLRDALRTCPRGLRVGVVFVDLDRFKPINDTYGHAAGDDVLKVTAERLSGLVRHGDLAARLAGDEFVLVLTQLTPDWDGEQFFARASAVLSEPLVVEGIEVRPSASLGAVLADPSCPHDDVDGLIKAADAAMYQAKAARRAASR